MLNLSNASACISIKLVINTAVQAERVQIVGNEVEGTEFCLSTISER